MRIVLFVQTNIRNHYFFLLYRLTTCFRDKKFAKSTKAHKKGELDVL